MTTPAKPRATKRTDEMIKVRMLPQGKVERHPLVAPGLYLHPRHKAEGTDAKRCQGNGRVAMPFGFTRPDPGVRLSRTRLFPKVARVICVAEPTNE